MTVPKVKTFSAKGSRFYVHPDTEESVPGVTSILNTLPKPFLKAWAAKVVAEYAVEHQDNWMGLDDKAAIDLLKRAPQRYTTERADIGSEAHDAFEKIGNGEDPGPIRLEVDPYVQHFKQFMADWKPEFLHQEATIWSNQYRYAGSLDAIARIGDEVVVMDYKTTKSVYAEVGLQLSAYRFADMIIDEYGEETPLPEITGGAVLHVTEKGYSLIPIRCDEDVFDIFVGLRTFPFEWNAEISKTIVGKPLRVDQDA